MKIFKILLIFIAIFPSLIFSERIITLAPALTEIVFALGKGDSIVGNTKFCDFPEKARTITKVGGFMDLNVEMVIHLKPDLIILYPENFEKMKILKNRTKLLIVKHKTLNHLYEAIITISKELKKIKKGKLMVSNIKIILEKICKDSTNKKKVKTLLIAGRNPDQLSNMTIIGKKDFLNQVLEISGGINAYEGSIEYPNISIESIISMNPDFIIEFSVFFQGIDKQKVMDIWNKYKIIRAVKNNKIKIITDPKWLRPGPRIGEITLELFDLLKNS